MKPHQRNLLAVAALILGAPALHAADGTWTKNATGTQNWTTIGNWLGGTAYAEGTDSTATLGDVITADRTITLNAPITIGNITAAVTGLHPISPPTLELLIVMLHDSE